MKLIATFNIKNGSATDRSSLRALAKDARFGIGKNLVYIYELSEGEPPINYPICEGRILYIGEAGRASEPTGKRFGQHISPSLSKGSDSGTNFVLSQYYHSGRSLALSVYEVLDESSRTRAERDLLVLHLRKYGSPPIAQGATGQGTSVANVAAYADQVSDAVKQRHYGG
jgi:hypothetical protein